VARDERGPVVNRLLWWEGARAGALSQVGGLSPAQVRQFRNWLSAPFRELLQIREKSTQTSLALSREKPYVGKLLDFNEEGKINNGGDDLKTVNAD